MSEIKKIVFCQYFENLLKKNSKNNFLYSKDDILNKTNKSGQINLFEKIKSYIPIEFEGNTVSCLNERLSFLKYSPGEYFKAHQDGYYIRPDNSEISYITVQIYLNDLKEEDGGSTTFIKDTYNKIYQDYSVIPKVGRVLLFEHELEHEGSILKNGLKNIINQNHMLLVKN